MERIKYFKPVTKAINLMAVENGSRVMCEVLKSVLLQWEYKMELLERILENSEVDPEDIKVIEGIAENFHISKSAVFDMDLADPINTEEWVLQLASAADCLSAYRELVMHISGAKDVHKALTPYYLLSVYVDFVCKDAYLYTYVTSMIADVFPGQEVIFASNIWNHYSND